MDEYQRHKKAFQFFVSLIRRPLYRWFHYSCDSLGAIPGPYLLLSNHNTDFDPAFVSFAAENQLYFVATEHIMRKKLISWFVGYYFKPILHTKGVTGSKTALEIMRTLRRGQNVCLFAEGNRSFNGVTGEIAPSVAKLAKKSGVKLVTFRLEGGYLTQPRWGRTMRRGRLCGRLAHVYEPEALKAMTDSEVYAAIQADLYENAWATQEKQHAAYRGKKLAEGLEAAVYCCPCCGKIGTLRTEKAVVNCGCGFRAEYDEYGWLNYADGTRHTVAELDSIQKQCLAGMLQAAKENTPLFEDAVTCGKVNNRHRMEQPQSGFLRAFPDGFELLGRRYCKKDIAGIAVFSRSTLIFHTDDGTEKLQYEIKGGKNFSALKYMDLHRILGD